MGEAFFSVILIFAGLLFLLLPAPLVWRKIPMNHLYGVRIPKSFESEKLWYQINWSCKINGAAGQGIFRRRKEQWTTQSQMK